MNRIPLLLIFLLNLGIGYSWAQSAKFYDRGNEFRFSIPTEIDSLKSFSTWPGYVEIHAQKRDPGNGRLYHDSVWIKFDSVAIGLDQGQMIDPRDLTIYPTIQIGSKIWFASNLNYGRSIAWNRAPGLKDSTEKYCPFQNQDSCAKYGALYWWSEAMQLPDSCDQTGCASLIQKQHRGICPVGWHIPSRAEWKQLIAVLGNRAGSRMNALSGYPSWDNGFYNDSNTSGFSARPTGFIWSQSQNAWGNKALYWAANDTGTQGQAMGYSLDATSGDLLFNDGDWKTTGEAIRCVQDSAIAIPKQMTDLRDSQVYQTAIFGDREWMTENLNYGTMKTATEYQMLSQTFDQNDPTRSDKACFNNSILECDTLGALYQWTVAMALPTQCATSDCDSLIQKPYHQGLCPEQWHVPTPEDFNALLKWHGGGQIAGSRLGDSTGFNSQNSGWSHPESIFHRSAVPQWNQNARYWNTHQMEWNWKVYGGSLAISTDESVVRQSESDPNQAFSLRCVKNP